MTNEITQELAVSLPAQATAPALHELAHTHKQKPRSPWWSAWQQFRQHRLAVIGALTFVLIIVGTLVGPYLYTTPYNKVDFAVAAQGPSWAYPFGTNDLGQDLLARVLWGGRISVAVSLFAMLVAITLGTLIGALAGFFGGSLDQLLMRVTDIFLALPQLPLLLLIIYLFREPITKAVGPELGIFVLIVLIIGGLNWMSVARLVRANFLVLREAEFITAAHAVGVPEGRIIRRHLLPNTLGPVIVAATLAVGSAIITESSLSFLGLGFPPDTPTWGRMLFEAQNFVEFTPSMALFPGFFIFITVLSINYIGDGLRDALDPQLRTQ
ncbi:MAG: ABC transporter permease [Caldilineaceae bacterium]|nr:ABC transporter permease [Caldilineaceae bacterium]